MLKKNNYMILFTKKFLFAMAFNFTLFFLLIIGIQNSLNKSKVNFIINETISLPISFIIGISFISGSITGSILGFKFDQKKDN